MNTWTNAPHLSEPTMGPALAQPTTSAPGLAAEKKGKVVLKERGSSAGVKVTSDITLQRQCLQQRGR